MTTQSAPSPYTSGAAGDADGTTDGSPFGYEFFLPSWRLDADCTSPGRR